MRKPPVLLSYAFRPFFLLSGLAAVATVAAWILMLDGALPWLSGPNVLLWHGHEMLVGFVMATIAGFVLTAVSTWTGRAPVSGFPLLLLVIFWMAGRIAMAAAGILPGWLIATVDMLFPAWFCALAWREIVFAGNRRNYPVLAVSIVLALLNLAFHLELAGAVPGNGRLVLYLFIHTVLLLITIIGGRILPNFTANWMRGQGIERLPSNNRLADRLAIIATLVAGGSLSFFPMSAIGGWLAVAAAILHLWRLSQWRGMATFREPLLFVLHLSYLWIPLGYAMTGLAVLGGIGSATGALHVLTMGAIGGMILAMVTRVPLGHTGRPLHASRLTVCAYLLLIFAVLGRIVISPGRAHYLDMITLAGFAWCGAFLVFLFVYVPVLTQARVDRPEQ